MTRFGSMARALACVALPALLAGCWWDDNNATPAGAPYSVGGTIAGLNAAGLVLANGTDTVSPASGATAFAFGGVVAQGGSYAVTVKSQPAGATCSVANGSGTVAGANVGNVQVACAAITYTVGGSITGLTTSGLVLANGADTVSPAATATGFTLPTGVAQGGTYTITVKTQPAGEQCSLTSSTGTINGANVTNVAVACAALTHTLGGTISGLPSAGLVLANGSDTVSPGAGALSFTFTLPVAEGGAYAVSVQTQPSGATCSVGGGTGTMGTANVANAQVTCAANAYKVGGTISGLTASGLILANGSDTVSPSTNATGFTMPHTVAFGGSYSVTVTQQPAGLSCAVAGTFPATMGAADVSNIAVSCSTPTAFTLIAGQQTCPAPGPGNDFGTSYVDGTGANASVPANAMTRDAAGNFYVVSGYLRKITPAGVVTTIAGQYYNGGSGNVDGTGAAVVFNAPDGVATDSAGNIYVSEDSDVRKSTAAGVVTTLAGSATRGYLDATGSAAMFQVPQGLALDSAGNVYVTDNVNSAIRKISPSGVVTTLAGGVSSGFADGTGPAAKFNQPGGIVVDASGNLLVTDRNNNAIRKITPAGVVTTLAGQGNNMGWTDGSGGAALFYYPTAIAMDSAGNAYVIDQLDSAIRVISTAGVVSTFAYTVPAKTNSSYAPVTSGIPLPDVVQAITIDPSGAPVIGLGCSIQKIGP